MEVEYYDEIEEIHCDARNASVPAGSGPLRFSACQRHHLPHLDRRGDPRAVGGYDPFETLNSDYYLSMDPFPMAAVFPAYTALAACA